MRIYILHKLIKKNWISVENCFIYQVLWKNIYFEYFIYFVILDTILHFVELHFLKFLRFRVEHMQAMLLYDKGRFVE